MLISVIFNNGYSQTEKQVQEIIKDYDMAKANLLLQNVKQREFLQKKEVETFAKKTIYQFSRKAEADPLTNLCTLHQVAYQFIIQLIM